MNRRRVALCVLHGIGAQRRQWADEFVARVRRAVAERDPDIDVFPCVIWWAPITQRYEDELARRYARGLSWSWLRRLVIGYGGDVIAYQAPSSRDAPPSWMYGAVHRRLDRRLRGLRGLLDPTGGGVAGPPVPLVTVAHSLGSVIFSDFIYDAQAGGDPETFVRRYGLALCGLFTIGSPLALYAIRYPHLGFDRPITLRSGGTWINVLYRADVIAHPLRVASDAYARAVSEDWVLPWRLWDWSWTPVAHLAYWNDGRLIARVADQLARAAARSLA
ncbi:MAG: hypothetical protein DMD41_07985 [Gemmatimonadetes bacterium]|nr:MAG: hypothetical protein AUH46_07010 [Gemmatimonadetes bacterium 13_1_40CM_70_15]PYP72853.1 MAG: hypothetical protein DMD41_07985 [Gemmatimonadota bacterium]